MYLFGKRADEITELEIEMLLENQFQENKNLDYKRDLNFSKDSDRKEFLFDVSAMHNSEGGCLIFGIEELKDEKGQNTGKPSNVVGIEIQNLDKLTQQIENLVKNSTEPNISQLIIKKLEIDSAKILIIGVPKGLGLPTMVTFNRTNKFYKRGNTGKFLVDVYELNNMFMQNQVLLEKAYEFRNKRIDAVLNLQFNPNLVVDHSFFLHIIPYSFLTNSLISLALFEKILKKKMKPFNYGANDGWMDGYNFDGFSTYSSNSASAFESNKITSYNQIFRDGIYEVYSSNIFNKIIHKKGSFDGRILLMSTIESVTDGLSILNDLEVEPPFFVGFSFRNVKGVIKNSEIAHAVHEFTNDALDFPLIQIPSHTSDIEKLLKPNFDILWQTFGSKESPI